MSEPVTMTPGMQENLPTIKEYLAKGDGFRMNLSWMEQGKMVEIFNAHFAGPFNLRQESPRCRPCIDKVYNFFKDLKVV